METGNCHTSAQGVSSHCVQRSEKTSVFLNFNKVTEQIISEMLVSDMKAKFARSQFGNQKGTGVQNYLVKMIHTILCTLENNRKGDT